MDWLFYAVLAQFFVAFSVIIDRYVLSKKMRNAYSYNILTMLVDIIPISLFVLLFPVTFVFPGSILGILVGFAFVAGLLFYNMGMIKEEASRIVSLSFTYPLFTAVLATVFLKEPLGTMQYIGIAAMVSGAVLISVKKFSFKGFKWIGNIFWLLILSSFLIGVEEVIAKYALNNMEYWQFWFWTLIGSITGGILMLSRKKQRNDFLRNMKRLEAKTFVLVLGTCVSFYISVLLTFIALTKGYVFLVSAIGTTQPVFTLSLAVAISLWNPRILGENIGKNALIFKIAAILLIVLGGYMLTSQGYDLEI